MIIALEILLIVLAAVLKAVADTVSDHFDVSIFKGKNPFFWDKATAAKYAPFLKWTKYRVDCWHLCNSGFIISLCLLAVIHVPILKWYLELLLAGIIFNPTFNLFYNKILRRKNA